MPRPISAAIRPPLSDSFPRVGLTVVKVDGLEGDRQRAVPENEPELRRVVLAEVAADRRGAAGDPLVALHFSAHLWMGLDDLVEGDRELTLRIAVRAAGEFPGHFLELLAAVAREAEAHAPGQRPTGRRRRFGLRAGHVHTAQRRRAQPQLLPFGRGKLDPARLVEGSRAEHELLRRVVFGVRRRVGAIRRGCGLVRVGPPARGPRAPA